MWILRHCFSCLVQLQDKERDRDGTKYIRMQPKDKIFKAALLSEVTKAMCGLITPDL